MNNGYTSTDLTQDQAKELLLETIKKQKPETTQKLIRYVHEQTGLSEEELTKLIIRLEEEDKLHFTEREAIRTPVKRYIFSANAAWYWIVILLSAATGVSVFAIPENAYPLVYLRAMLGVIFVLFLPGYALIKMLFPSKVPIPTNSENMDTIERAALSLGLNLALVPLLGLALNYTPLGIGVAPVTLGLLALTVAFATAAVLRGYQTKKNQTN